MGKNEDMRFGLFAKPAPGNDMLKIGHGNMDHKGRLLQLTWEAGAADLLGNLVSAMPGSGWPRTLRFRSPAKQDLSALFNMPEDGFLVRMMASMHPDTLPPCPKQWDPPTFMQAILLAGDELPGGLIVRNEINDPPEETEWPPEKFVFASESARTDLPQLFERYPKTRMAGRVVLGGMMQKIVAYRFTMNNGQISIDPVVVKRATSPKQKDSLTSEFLLLRAMENEGIPVPQAEMHRGDDGAGYLVLARLDRSLDNPPGTPPAHIHVIRGLEASHLVGNIGKPAAAFARLLVNPKDRLNLITGCLTAKIMGFQDPEPDNYLMSRNGELLGFTGLSIHENPPPSPPGPSRITSAMSSLLASEFAPLLAMQQKQDEILPDHWREILVSKLLSITRFIEQAAESAMDSGYLSSDAGTRLMQTAKDVQGKNDRKTGTAPDQSQHHTKPQQDTEPGNRNENQ